MTPNTNPATERANAAQPDRNTATTVLAGESIEKRYGSVEVLSDVSIEIPAAAVTALVGPNGTGKTTLLRLLLGLETPTSGSITYEGPQAPRRIGYLPQRPSFRPGFTVAETIEFYASLVETAVDSDRILDRVRLTDARNRPVEALSGGMTRLLGVGQSIVGSPPVVIFDEPASGLDPTMAGRVFEVADELAAAGTAVVLTSHNLSLVSRHADRVGILSDGMLTELTAPQTLATRYGTENLWEAYHAVVTADPANNGDSDNEHHRDVTTDGERQ